MPATGGVHLRPFLPPSHSHRLHRPGQEGSRLGLSPGRGLSPTSAASWPRGRFSALQSRGGWPQDPFYK